MEDDVGNYHRRRPTPMTLARLRELVRQDEAEIVMLLSRDRTSLDNVISDLSQSEEDTRLVLRVFGKACRCESQPEQLNAILSRVLQSPFIESRLMVLLTEASHYTDREALEDILRDCIPLIKQLLQRMPTASADKVSAVIIKIEKIWSKTSMLDEELNQDMCSIRNMLTRLRPPEVRCAEPQVAYSKYGRDEQPPEDFREVSIYPTKQELLSDGPQHLFYRRNEIAEKYNDVNHYLDVQFRLLRADYIIPLQESIAEFQSQLTDDTKRESALRKRVYYNVRIVRPVCSHNGLSYRLSFSLAPGHSVNWATSRRLMFGSLVCLSSDRFVNNFMFATVYQRKESLKSGTVDVLFEASIDLPRDTRFTMVESQAYFEAYKHVLEGMQRLNERNIPFQSQIVECKSNVQMPRYLENTANPVYDLRPLIDDNYSIRDGDNVGVFQQQFSEESSDAAAVEIANSTKWPEPERFHLDKSQMKALQHALTSEFSLIQGPPGTGKTYLGLKILKALLHNRNVWSGGENVPILVVCYTNHALDQFLEGILKFFRGKLIRVGSRSKSENSQLQECKLTSARQTVREARDVPTSVFTTKVEISTKKSVLKAEIHGIATRLEVAEREIVHENSLREYMTPQQESFFPNTRSSVIAEWLGITKDLKYIDDLEEPKPEDDEEEVGEEVIDVVSQAETAQQQRLLDDDDFDDILDADVGGSSVDVIKVRQETLGFEVTKLGASSETLLTGQTRRECDEKRKRKRRLKKKLRTNIESVDRMSEQEASRVDNMWNIKYRDRWRLYRYWVDRLCRQSRGQIRDKEQVYDRICKRFKEILLQEDKRILKNACIVGMTTTAAARYQSIMSEIEPKIIIVEEAAEVLEAHVIATLSRGCQHLILIGDHKQLRPNPTVHRLAKQYNLEISLFERMVRCNVHLDCLQWQHRMRPEISRMMRTIYPNLQDARSVKSYPDVSGVSQNVCFIEHSYPHEVDEERRSCVNQFEAEYIVSLCEYLLKQGYQRQQITIISMYSAQINALRRLMPKSKFEGVRVASVDSYQGEENDIVLVSMVRSDTPGETIGFLKTDNRICVALSRAKHGMYVLGNFRFLTEKSDLIRDIITTARKDDYLKDGLQLVCPRHRTGKGVLAKEARDFLKVPEGGCLKPCESRLPCGHTCTRTCHSGPHSQCYFPCTKFCEKGHPCSSLCYACSSGCPPCKEPVQKQLPKCGHRQMVPCSTDPRHFQCKEKVKVERPCGHIISVECCQSDTATCTGPCSQILSCGDPCTGTCGSCFQGRLNQPCKEKCKKILVCGHECSDTCNNCPPCKRPCENRCHHSVCPKRCGEPCVPCKMPCPWQCRHKKCSRLCSEVCDRDRCDEKCRKRLSCGHPCIGMCGEPCPRLCRVCNKDDDAFKPFFGNEDDPNSRFVELQDCSHVFEVTSLDRWMDKTDDGDQDDKLKKGDDNEDDDDKCEKAGSETRGNMVLLKVCPRCKTPIRRNLRYGSVVNETLQCIEAIKQKIIGSERRVRELDSEIDAAARSALPSDRADIDSLRDKVVVKSESQLAAQLNQVRILLQVSSYERKVSDAMSRWRSSCEDFHCIARDLQAFRSWILQYRSVFTEQEVIDADRELRRLSLLLYLLKSRKIIDVAVDDVPPRLMRQMAQVVQQLQGSSVLSRETLQLAETTKEELTEYVPESRIGVTEEERLMIVHAMNMKQGHWWRCDRGHVYAIGECGRPTERAVCPECRDEIGGEDHALAASNSWAPEMDEAEQLPWSEELDYMLALQLQFQ